MFQKPFIVEDGQFYYPKKPLHKQPLFWTTIAGAIFSLFLGVIILFMSLAWVGRDYMEDTNSTPGVEDYQTTEEFDNPDFYTEHILGESEEVDTDLEMVVGTLKIDDSIKLITDADTAVVTEVTLKNTGSDDYYLDEFEFILYDNYDQGYYLDYRSYDANLPEKIAPGEAVTLKLIYGVDEADWYGLSFQGHIWKESIGGTV